MKNLQKKLEKLAKNSDNELTKSVIDDILDKEEEAENYIQDVLSHGCVSGIVTSLIYHHDTKQFYNCFSDEIDELKEEVERDTGENLKIESPSYNWLAWFGYEETMRKIANEIGM